MLSSGHGQQQVPLEMRASLAVVSMNSSAPCSSPASPVPLAGRRHGRPAQQPQPAAAPAARTSQPRPQSGQAPAVPCCARRRGPCRNGMSNIMQKKGHHAEKECSRQGMVDKPASCPGVGTVPSQRSSGGMFSCLGLVSQCSWKYAKSSVELKGRSKPPSSTKRDECSRQAPA